MCRPLPGWHLAVQLGGSAEGREVGWKVQAGEPGRGRRADAAWSKHTKNFVRHLPPCTPPPTAESALEQSCEARKGVPQASEAAVDAPCAVGRRSWYSLWGGGRYSSRLPHVAVACRAWGPAPRASPRVQLLLCCALCHHASAPLPASSSSALSQPAGPLFLLQGSPFPVFPSMGQARPRPQALGHLGQPVPWEAQQWLGCWLFRPRQPQLWLLPSHLSDGKATSLGEVPDWHCARSSESSQENFICFLKSFAFLKGIM